MAQLQEWLRAHASPTFSLPAAPATSPTISWAGALTTVSSVATSLPNGIVYAASDTKIGGAIRNRYASVPSAPNIGSLPALLPSRPYTCKGNARNVGSQVVMRLKTDAPVLELSGVLPDGAQTVQTLIVDGKLVAPKALSSSRGVGGWVTGTIRIDFGSRATRDVWIETAMAVAHVKIDATDTLFAPDDASEPQFTAIGDSYLQGRSDTFANGGGIALEIGARLGVRKVATDAIGGTGYQNSNENLGNFTDRLPAHSADNSIVYLLLGGLNDYGDIVNNVLIWSSRAQYESLVLDYIKNLRAAQPKALIAVTAPFCPVPPQSDSTYTANPAINSSGQGDFLYKAALHKQALQQIAGPWVFIDVLMGGGWLNSSGATGDITGLQWFTGGTPGANTTSTYKPGNTLGGGGGGFGGVDSVQVTSGGHYTQAPEITATGGSGQGLLLAGQLNSAGALSSVTVVLAGHDYTSGAGLPIISIDPTYEITPATLGTPILMQGDNINGQYPLPSFAPLGATDLNNIYRYMSHDHTHPSPLGYEYIAKRLAQNIYDAVMAL